MKLDEKDVKAVASARFWQKRQWYLLGGLFVAIVISLLIIATVQEPLDLIGGLPLLAFLVYLLILTRQETKAQKALLKEWGAKAGVVK